MELKNNYSNTIPITEGSVAITKVKEILKSSFESPKQASTTLQNVGYRLDSELSTDDTKVFVDEKNNPHVVFRGTTLDKGFKTAINDINTDIKIGLGITTQREKDAKKKVEKIKEKYGNKPITGYGYSLGAKILESTPVTKKITYNKAVGLRDIGKVIPPSQTDIRTSRDLISLPVYTQKRRGKLVTLPVKTLNPYEAHSLKML